MVVIDHLYGAITIPEWLYPVVLSPEVQRLREVRLINTSSPSCAALSDVRRFTHTLGVMFLALLLEKKISNIWSKEEARAFLVASLLHDVGTPAFGHIFEYQLAAIEGWEHEKFVERIIRGTYRPEKRYHQIYYSNPLRLHSALDKISVDIDLIVSLVRGETPLGKILAGSIDLDNIDNVHRMASLLGLHPNARNPIRLVDSIIPDRNGPTFDMDALSIIESWQELRRLSYNILAFDESCLSGQAMLTECLSTALRKKILGEEHWFFTDEQLLHHLLLFDDTKEIIRRFAIGDFYDKLFLGWYSCPKGDIDLRHPEKHFELQETLRTRIGIPCYLYVFYDKGTFTKDLTINVRFMDSSLESVVVGQKSESTIVGVFTRKRISPNERRKFNSHVIEVLEQNGLPSSRLSSIPAKEDIYGLPGQKTIPF